MGLLDRHTFKVLSSGGLALVIATLLGPGTFAQVPAVLEEELASGLDWMITADPALAQRIASISLGESGTLAERAGFRVPGTIWSFEASRQFVEALKSKALVDPQIYRAVCNLDSRSLTRLNGGPFQTDEKAFLEILEVSIQEDMAARRAVGIASAQSSDARGDDVTEIRRRIRTKRKEGKIGDELSGELQRAATVNRVEIALNCGSLWNNEAPFWVSYRADQGQPVALREWAGWTCLAGDLRRLKANNKLGDEIYQELRNTIKLQLAEIQENGSGIWSSDVRAVILDNANAGEAAILHGIAEIAKAGSGLKGQTKGNAFNKDARAVLLKVAELTNSTEVEAAARTRFLSARCHWLNLPHWQLAFGE